MGGARSLEITMEILINDTTIKVGDILPVDAVSAAGLRPVNILNKLLKNRNGRRARFAAECCTVDLFAGGLRVYPCTHGYLDRDRQWRTAAEIHVERGRVRRVLIRVLEGRYAAPEFVDRFNQLCTRQLGEAKAVEGRLRRWRNGVVRCSSCLQPDGKNADFVIELVG